MNNCNSRAKIWMPNTSPLRDKQYNVSKIASNTFPHLDIDFLYNVDRELEYQVHKNQIKNLSI